MNRESQQYAVETQASSPSPRRKLPRLDQRGGPAVLCLSNQQPHPWKRLPCWHCVRPRLFQCKGQRSLDSPRVTARGCESNTPTLPTVAAVFYRRYCQVGIYFTEFKGCAAISFLQSAGTNISNIIMELSLTFLTSKTTGFKLVRIHFHFFNEN